MFQTATAQQADIGGYCYLICWEACGGKYHKYIAELKAENRIGGAWQAGRLAWGKSGLVVTVTRNKFASLYSGSKFDVTIGAVIARDKGLLSAIYCFFQSTEYIQELKKLDPSLSVTESALLKVPFDLDRWQQVAAEEYPNGLPEPHSDDPTQWLFKGHPRGSTDPLQVAVARLLGYRWPDQEADELDKLADGDGIVPIPAVRGEPPASERLHHVLRTAFGAEWSGALETKLLAETGARPGTALDDWLRNAFFEQHCKRFHHRPFVWHLWDGRKDGFACLVNYHKLDHKRLETLAYAYVQDWINAQAADARRGQTGADLRLGAAQALQEKLKRILAGEPPYDIFVRWKPLAEQPIGWHPALNDGVRLNIRPFVEAGILRRNPNVKWTKDRGNEPKRDKEQFPWFWHGDTPTGERVNDRHYTNAEKLAARSGNGGHS